MLCEMLPPPPSPSPRGGLLPGQSSLPSRWNPAVRRRARVTWLTVSLLASAPGTRGSDPRVHALRTRACQDRSAVFCAQRVGGSVGRVSGAKRTPPHPPPPGEEALPAQAAPPPRRRAGELRCQERLRDAGEFVRGANTDAAKWRKVARPRLGSGLPARAERVAAGMRDGLSRRCV